MPDTPPLAGLTTLLADDPTVVAASAGQGHTVAVPEPARAIFTATLANATARRPVLVAVPTRAEAERVAGDLRQYLGDDAVELFPAWETLPFERVSPERGDDGPAPARHVAAPQLEANTSRR